MMNLRRDSRKPRQHSTALPTDRRDHLRGLFVNKVVRMFPEEDKTYWLQALTESEID